MSVVFEWLVLNVDLCCKAGVRVVNGCKFVKVTTVIGIQAGPCDPFLCIRV